MPTAMKKAIATELRAIRKELWDIRKHMVDFDMILIPEEAGRLEYSLKEFKEGRTCTLDELVRNRVAR